MVLVSDVVADGDERNRSTVTVSGSATVAPTSAAAASASSSTPVGDPDRDDVHRVTVVDVLGPKDLLTADAHHPHRSEVADLVVAASEDTQERPW